MGNDTNNDSFEEFEDNNAENSSDNSDDSKNDDTEKTENKTNESVEDGEAPLPRGRENSKLQPVKGTSIEDGVRNVTQLMTEDAKRIKKILDDQPKTDFYIPLTAGEKLGQAYETVTINGYRLEIKKGMMVPVPQQVASMLADFLNIQTSVGLDLRIENKKEDVQKALS